MIHGIISWQIFRLLLAIYVLYFSENAVLIINPGVGDRLQVSNTDDMLNSYDETEHPSGNYHVIYVICYI